MALAEPNEEDNLATQHFYTPGLPAWEAASQYSRIPIIVTNPTDKAVRSVPMSLKLCELALIDWSRAKDALGVVRAQDGRQSEIPFQVVADDELLFALDELGPRECATVFVYLNSAARLKTQARVTYRETGDGFEVDNGALKLVKLESEGGYAFDRISLGAVEVGSFAPVIWQQVGQDFWVRPSRVEAVEAHEGPVALVLDMIFLFDGGRAAAITEVGPEGKYAAIETRPHRYRTKYRFTIHPDKPYFDSRFLWVENTDEEPWHFHTYYHYIPSNIAGDSSDDKPKAKYWLDAAAKLCYGVEAPDGFSVILWKDSAGLEHPDVYRCPYFSRTLKPGERLAAADPPVHTIAGSEDEFARAADELHALSDLHIQVCEIESADIPAQRHYDRAGMKVARFPGNPIIRPNMDGRMGNNVNGPSLIRVPGWVKNPLGRYYLYFAHHKGEYIRLAYADQLEGPWTTYEPGTLRLEDSFCGHHIASPDVHVDNEKREVRMYYHGPTTGGQKSRVAISKDGIHFTARPEILGAPYLRVFRWGGFYYALGMPGIFYRSKDGLSNFEQGPTLLTENMRHSAFKLDGNRLSVFYSDIGDCPERILLSTIELTPDWMTWKASEPVIVLEPEMDYEGADLPLKPSRSGWAPESVRQLRDPAVFREEGRTYLLYSVAGEQGIAIAELKEQA